MNPAAGVLDEVARVLPAARRGEPIGPLTTYRVGGPGALVLHASGRHDLEAAREAVVATGVEVLVIGKGSNLLVADGGFPGLVVLLDEGFDSIELERAAIDGRVRAGASVSLPVLARRTTAAALSGFEWAVGVPGSVGGAVRMNAGGHGAETAETLVSAEIVDLAGGRDGTIDASELGLGYRRSNIRASEVVVAATFALEPGDAAQGAVTISEIVRWRREHQPGGQNAGSVFTNPPGESAGRLIDACGLKGHRRGSAYVSPKHANFFQADEGGSADDVAALIAEVRERVLAETGIDLVPELRMIGFHRG